jgi:hypothetical protein
MTTFGRSFLALLAATLLVVAVLTGTWALIIVAAIVAVLLAVAVD